MKPPTEQPVQTSYEVKPTAIYIAAQLLVMWLLNRGHIENPLPESASRNEPNSDATIRDQHTEKQLTNFSKNG